MGRGGEASEGDFVFIENLPIKNHLNKIKKMIVYNWGERYPADFYLDTPPTENGFSLSEKYEFTGSSHEKITREIYVK